MSDLSPAAQAILDATYNTFDLKDSFSLRKAIAEALRVAAERLGQDLEFYDTCIVTATDLFIVANELEGE